MKGISAVLSNFDFRFFSKTFTFIDFSFINLKNFTVAIDFSTNFLRFHKLKLKLLVKKTQSNLSLFNFLRKINKFIFLWTINYNFIDCLFDVWNDLDIYLYRLLWGWVRRRHPRRPNTWIYSRYWKSFSGFHRFYAVRNLNNDFCILRSHFYIPVFVSLLSSNINFYSHTDTNKINFFYFKKFELTFCGIFKYFWLKQKGICLICKKNFYSFDFNFMKVYNLNCLKSDISNFALLHYYCLDSI